jgi:hypothetical protein
MRDEDGTPGADCRINGEDYESGMEALRSYVATWPEAGLEFRKQSPRHEVPLRLLVGLRPPDSHPALRMTGEPGDVAV